MKARLMATFLSVVMCADAPAQTPIKHLVGMWSDPPATIVDQFCAGICTDAGIDRLKVLLDDPANDGRPLAALQGEANTYQNEKYFRTRLTEVALKTYPLDPADDPSFLRCEPYGFARQIVARHQLQIREAGKDRLEFRYGEWDARRMIYMDGRKRQANQQPTLLGFSTGHWEGDTLVIETSGIRADIIMRAQHSDRLRVTERYIPSKDRMTLTLAATFEDPQTFREPVVLKHIWGWRPDQKIAAYDQCEIPKEFKRGTQ